MIQAGLVPVGGGSRYVIRRLFVFKGGEGSVAERTAFGKRLYLLAVE
jgi:hypothetical protein